MDIISTIVFISIGLWAVVGIGWALSSSPTLPGPPVTYTQSPTVTKGHVADCMCDGCQRAYIAGRQRAYETKRRAHERAEFERNVEKALQEQYPDISVGKTSGDYVLTSVSTPYSSRYMADYERQEMEYRKWLYEQKQRELYTSSYLPKARFKNDLPDLYEEVYK